MFNKKLSVFFKQYILDILFPIRCVSCAKYDYYLCPECRKQIKLKVLKNNIENIDVLSFFHYDSNNILVDILKIIKYSYNTEAFNVFQEILRENSYIIQEIQKDFKDYKKIYLIPVPLHKKRYKERLFNQSEEFAKIFKNIFQENLSIKVEILNDLFIRQINNNKQARLSKEERLANVQNIFLMSNLYNLEQNTLICFVDDVITTGSTLLSLSNEFRKYYSNNILFLTMFSAL